MIKGGADQGTVFETIRRYMEQGKTIDEAIEKVESIMRSKLPRQVKVLIYEEFK